MPLLSVPRYVDDPKRCRATSSTSTSTTTTSSAGRLPAVAYIAPAGASEHPPGRIAAGADARPEADHGAREQQRLEELGLHVDLRRLGRLVRPRAAAAGRADSGCPALLVSPYARRGYVDSTTPGHHLDPPHSSRTTGGCGRWPARCQARSFAAGLRLLAPAARAEHPRRRASAGGTARDPRRWVIYLGYGAALAAGRRARSAGSRRSAGRAGAPSCALLAAVRGARGRRSACLTRSRPSRRCRACASALDGIEFRGGRRGPSASTCRRPRRRALRRARPPRSRPASEPGSTAGTPAAGSPRSTSTTGSASASSTSADSRVDPRAGQVGDAGGAATAGATCSGASEPRWLQGNRVVPESGGRKIDGSCPTRREKALVGGSSVVHRASSASFPAETPQAAAAAAAVLRPREVRDALLGFPIGSAVRARVPERPGSCARPSGRAQS